MTGDDATMPWLVEMWARAPRPFRADADGASLACLGWNLDARDRPGIVLVHGFRAHAHWWDHIAPALAADYRVVAFSLSGMGDSDRRETYSRAIHGREVLAAAAAAEIERPIIVAHSYGAIASLLVCRAQPERIARIVVLDAALPTAHEPPPNIPMFPLRTYPDRETVIDRFRLVPTGGWPHPAILRHIADHAVTRLADGRWTWKFDHKLAAMLGDWSYRDEMLGITVPADIIYGDRTEIFTPERRASAPDILPGCSQYVALPHAHHHLMIEQPIALVAALRALLATPKA